MQGSPLTISQRILLPELPLTPIQERAQELATRLIQGYSVRHLTQEVVRFIHELTTLSVAEEGEHLRFPFCQRSSPPLSLPSGYGVKGGAARELLVTALSLRDFRQPRDIDLTRRGHHRIPQDEAIAKEYMGRDFALGARVELIRDMERYLSSRDLTINEVVVIDGDIYTSVLCVLDTIGHVIRPSRYRGGTLHRRPSLYGQSLLKMARLHAEGAAFGENWTICGIPEEVSFSEFDLAVHLNKAFQRGRNVADRFLQTCELLSLISASDDRIRATLQELEHMRHGERGLLPDVPEKEWVGIQPANSRGTIDS